MFYNRTAQLEGPNVGRVIGMEKLGEKVVRTGCCSLVCWANAGDIIMGFGEKAAKKELQEIIRCHEADFGREPLNILAYVDAREQGAAIDKLVNLGFNLLEYLPGGHGYYDMALLSYTHNAHAFSTEEEKRVAGL